MLFPTVDYAVFLAISVAVYWLLPHRARLTWLGSVSIFFYASWQVAYLPLLLGVIGVGWGAAMLVDRSRDDAARTRLVLAAATVLLLGPLMYYKYWPWIGEMINSIAGWAGAQPLIDATRLPLPVGVSFFSFQVLAYVIDVRRGEAADRNPWRVMSFICFFPHLVAGPIVRGRELLPTLRELPGLRANDVGGGLYRIGLGMLKKIVLADVLSSGMVDPLFSDPERFSSLELMLGLYAYTLQIYCDFSAYSDIAVGSAALFGIKLPENFNRPYKAASVAAFWRRWHMTLSNWVRDYVYFPMGGARVDAAWKVYRNLMMTMLILGIWHGASWNFVIYGLMHGSVVCLNRWQRKRAGLSPDDEPTKGWPWLWRVAVTLNFVVLARILFRADDLDGAVRYTEALLHFSAGIPRFSYTALAIFAVGWVAHFTPDDWERRIRARFVEGGPLVWALVLAGVGVACATLGTGEQLSFIYYSF